MTKIEDMSETERQSWSTLIVDSFVFVWFLNQTTYGSWMNVDILNRPAGEIMQIFIGLIIVTVILHAIIASVFAVRQRQENVLEKDERDIDIERKGAALGYGFLVLAINVIIVTQLLQYTLADYEPPLSLIEPPHMFFALMCTAFIGDIIKNGVMVLAYRGD